MQHLNTHASTLERNPDRKLADARHVRLAGIQEVTGPNEIVHLAPLRVVEDIECFRAELYSDFLGWFENLIHRHIDVGTMRRVQAVPAGITESQALRLGVGIGIEKQRPFLIGIPCGNVEGIPHNISKRAVRDDTVSHASRVSKSSVVNRERCPALRSQDSRVLPATEKPMNQPATAKRRKFVDPSYSQNMPLV